MNDNLTKRLLSLFPMKILADGFQTKIRGPKKEVVAEIVKSFQSADIVEWVNQNFEVSKHHIHVFACSPKVAKVPAGLVLDGEAPLASGVGEVLFLLNLEYTAVVQYHDKTFGTEKMNFKWPVNIAFAGDYVLLKMVIMEKKLSAHLDSELEVIKYERNIEERTIVSSAQKCLHNLSITVADLNKGTKKVWKLPSIDSSGAEWLTSVSTATQKMHVKKFIKRDLPEEFAQLMKSPLRKTIFDVIDGSTGYASPFIVDPGSGTITFPTYCDDPTHARHVVGKILQNN